MLKKPQNIYMPIDKFQAKVFKNKDTMSRGQWVENFALSLAGESEDDFANELITEAQISMYKDKLRKWKSYTKNNLINDNAGVVPTEKEIFDRCCEIFGDEFIEACDLVDSNTKKRRKNAAQEKSSSESNEQRVGGNSGQGLVTAPAAPGHKATAPSTRIAPAEPEVFNLAYSGEFANVRITQEQYNSLLMKFGNKVACDRAIDSLSAKLENGEKNPRSHYAELVKWANYRVDKAEEAENSATHYETVSEHNARVSAKADEWIHEHFGKKDATNG